MPSGVLSSQRSPSHWSALAAMRSSFCASDTTAARVLALAMLRASRLLAPVRKFAADGAGEAEHRRSYRLYASVPVLQPAHSIRVSKFAAVTVGEFQRQVLLAERRRTGTGGAGFGPLSALEFPGGVPQHPRQF